LMQCQLLLSLKRNPIL